MKLEKLINSGIPILCEVLLIIMVSLTFLQIVLRNFFDTGIPWSDDVAQFSMSWMALFGSIWLTKNSHHLNTGLRMQQKLKKRQIYLIDGILALLIAVIAVIVAYQTAIFSFKTMSIESMALSWLKMGYVYIALPISMLGVCYYYLRSFLKNMASLLKKD
jgi:TRAP-type C4-dicarboxylate transport system permease small subunit